MNKAAQEIASVINVSRQTIYREMKRNRRHAKRRTATGKSIFCKHRNNCPYKAKFRYQGFIYPNFFILIIQF